MPNPTFRELPTWLLSQAAKRSHQVLHQRLSSAGATAYEYRLLSAIHAATDATQAELGRLTSLDRRDVTVTMHALVDAGMATRRRSPDDARVLVVSLTAQGRRRYGQLDRLMQEVQDEVFGVLTPDRRQNLVESLSHLSD
jgi:DNA-binding MarR family transcriptional regulator